MSAGVELRELRTTAVAARGAMAVPREGDHASLGRLLRLIADPRCDETHVELAIAHHASNPPNPSRVLALSDHRHISNVGTLLSAVDRALASDATADRSMLCALARALATQSVSECSSTKHNLCVWTAPSKKRLALLQWMAQHRSAEAFRVVVEHALRDALGDDKTSQLTACLVMFELAQRQRRTRLRPRRPWAVLLDPLVAAMRSGSVQTATGPKPSKLGTAALDALIAVLCLMAPDETENVQHVVECMVEALSMVEQWNMRSARRQWLGMAAKQLASIVAMCGHDGARELFDMVMWHWNATAMWLCSRSDCVLTAKKSPAKDVARAVDQAYSLFNTNRGFSTVEQVSQHKIMSALRRLCALFSIHSSGHTQLLPTAMVQGKLLVTLTTCLVAPAVRGLALDMLRKILIIANNGDKGETDPVLHLSRVEAEAFVSLIERSATKSDYIDTGVASLVAELCYQAGLTVHNDHSSDDLVTARFWLTVTDSALDVSSAHPMFDHSMRTQWLRDTTKAVVRVLHHHSDKMVRTHAAALVPKLDLVECMQYIASSMLLDIDMVTSGFLVAWLYQCAEGNEALTTEISHVLVDSLCRGRSLLHPVVKPSDLGAPSTHGNAGDEAYQAAVLAKSLEVFGSPRDSTLVTWLREFSLLGWFDDVLETILPFVTNYITNLEKLSEELLEENSSDASRAVEHLLFARLAPNLVLRVIPRASFLSLYTASPCKLLTNTEAQNASTKCLSELAQALWSQVLDPFEYKEVKMLSIELLTKLPLQEILPPVLEILAAFVAGQGAPIAVVKVLAGQDGLGSNDDGFVVAKLLIYYLNLIFTDDSTAIHGLIELDKTLSVLLTVLSLPCAPNEAFSAAKSPLVDLQMGTIECLSLLVARSLKQSVKSQVGSELRLIEDAVVQVILSGFSSEPTQQQNISSNKCDDEDHPLRMFHKWRVAAQDSPEHERFSQTQARICCCNILLSALSKADAHSVSRFQTRIFGPRILASMQLELPPPVLAGCMQIAFSFFFTAGPALEREDKPTAEMVHTSVATVARILQNQRVMEDSVNMNALKLLGALIGKVSWLWSSLAGDTTTQQAIATGLQRLRDASTTSSPQVRQLAQSLLQAILSGATSYAKGASLTALAFELALAEHPVLSHLQVHMVCGEILGDVARIDNPANHIL